MRGLLDFMPINILAGMGGMSEFSMMTRESNIQWPAAYAGFLIGSALIGWATCHVLEFSEARATRRLLEAQAPVKPA